MEIKCYYEFLKDEFLLVWYCKKFSGTFIKNVYEKMSRIMSAIIYLFTENVINHQKNFFHTINLEIINFTMRQCIYAEGFAPSLFVILSQFVISGTFCKPSCRTLQFMSRFVTHSVKPKLCQTLPNCRSLLSFLSRFVIHVFRDKNDKIQHFLQELTSLFVRIEGEEKLRNNFLFFSLHVENITVVFMDYG